jgi:hypothetical protein
MKRTSKLLLVTVTVAALLVWAPTGKKTISFLPVVHAEETQSSCSLASLKGSYALDRQGTLVQSVLGLPAPAPWGEVAVDNFDGAGSFSGKATVNIGGAVLNGVVTGTYMVNSDCTGTQTVNTPVGLTVHEAIVVVDGRMIGTQTDPWAVIQTRAQKLGD